MAYCTFDNNSKQMEIYHNEEWGIPVYDDQKQFEFLSLEVMQCGMINDHDKNCPCYQKLIENYPTTKKKRYLEKNIRFFG